jgi:hypothetical protein
MDTVTDKCVSLRSLFGRVSSAFVSMMLTD